MIRLVWLIPKRRLWVDKSGIRNLNERLLTDIERKITANGVSINKKEIPMYGMYEFVEAAELKKPNHVPWNKGRLIGQKPPLKAQEIWSIRVRLDIDRRRRDLALFNLAIDSKLRGCDLVKLKVSDVAQGGRIRSRSQIVQQKTKQPVQFEITSQSRQAISDWVAIARLRDHDYLFPSRQGKSPRLSTRQYARIVERWVEMIGLDPAHYGTHSLRRTKATLIYRRTKNLRAVLLLLGHTKLESTIRYLGIEVDDALEIAEQTEV